jgi:hypothetical protein
MQEFISQNQILFWIMIVLIVLNIGIFVWLLGWRIKLKTLLNGKKGTDLEKIILKQEKDLLRLKEKLEKLVRQTNIIEGHALSSFQKIGLVRFNPFKDTGSNQSFSVALLDNHNNGVILSSLSSREGTRLYTKEVVMGQSLHSLSDEETKAINKALRQKPAGKTTRRKLKIA